MRVHYTTLTTALALNALGSSWFHIGLIHEP